MDSVYIGRTKSIMVQAVLHFSDSNICCSWLLFMHHYVPDAIPTHAAKVLLVVRVEKWTVALPGSGAFFAHYKLRLLEKKNGGWIAELLREQVNTW